MGSQHTNLGGRWCLTNSGDVEYFAARDRSLRLALCHHACESHRVGLARPLAGDRQQAKAPIDVPVLDPTLLLPFALHGPNLGSSPRAVQAQAPPRVAVLQAVLPVRITQFPLLRLRCTPNPESPQQHHRGRDPKHMHGAARPSTRAARQSTKFRQSRICPLRAERRHNLHPPLPHDSGHIRDQGVAADGALPQLLRSTSECPGHRGVGGQRQTTLSRPWQRCGGKVYGTDGAGCSTGQPVTRTMGGGGGVGVLMFML